MSLFVSRRWLLRTQVRLVLRFFVAMGVLTLAFGVAVAGRYLLGWW